MRDTSVPTPAIVDSSLIEAPFEVAMAASQVRRTDDAEANSTSALDGRDLSDATSASVQFREQRRAAKEAEKEAARLAKLEAKRFQAEQKRAAKDAKRKPDVVEVAEPQMAEPAVAEEKPPTPRATSSFDELMGYSQQ